MFRTVLAGVFLSAVSGFGTADDTPDVATELKPFQGKWKVVKAVAKEKELPVEELDMHFTFTGAKAEVTNKNGKQPGGEITVNPKRNPAEIDLKGDDPTKTTSLGIYAFGKDGKLTLFFVKNDSRPTSFDPAKNPDGILLTLEKVKE